MKPTNYADLRTVRTPEGTFVNVVDLIGKARIEAKDQVDREFDRAGRQGPAAAYARENGEHWVAWLSAIVENAGDVERKAYSEEKVEPPAAPKPVADCKCFACTMKKLIENGSIVPISDILPPKIAEEVEPPNLGGVGSYFSGIAATSDEPLDEVGSFALGYLSPGGCNVEFVIDEGTGKAYLDAEGLVDALKFWAEKELPRVHAGRPERIVSAMRDGVASVVLYLRNAIREIRGTG